MTTHAPVIPDAAVEAATYALSAHVDWGHDDRGAEDAARDAVKAAYPHIHAAVAESIQRDLIERMIADIDLVHFETTAFPFVFPGELEAWIRTYLPKEGE